MALYMSRIKLSRVFFDSQQQNQRWKVNHKSEWSAPFDSIETTTRCDIYWHFDAPSQNNLQSHKRTSHRPAPYLYQWPGCYMIEVPADTLELYVKHRYKLKTWVCPVRTCHRRFILTFSAEYHIKKEHPATEELYPFFLPPEYRSFDETSLEKARLTCVKIFESYYPTVDQQRIQSHWNRRRQRGVIEYLKCEHGGHDRIIWGLGSGLLRWS